ncbi:MAG: cation:H+ antiporter [Halocynthiibacter sp.]|jgi:cation:H+ antiporter
MDFVLIAVGLVILLLAGDALVRGAVNLSLRLGVPALVVSLTIVAFGTSAPELLIAVSAILDGVPGLAMGNVVGSNTANVLLVLGLPAIIAGLHTSAHDTRASYYQMIGATALFVLLAYTGPFTWAKGLILLLALAAMLAQTLAKANAQKKASKAAAVAEPEEAVEGADPDMAGWKIGMFLVIGLVGLPLGAELLVTASTNVAREFGVSEEVIGLTLVALGTSLPELATTVMAAIRRQADVALGNVIGSNMFNLLAIIGLASFIGPIPVDPKMLNVDIWVMTAASLMLGYFVIRRRDLTRIWGIGLVGLYVLYIGSVFI